MASRFETFFKNHAVPILNRQFGVTVTFIRGVYVSEEFTARRNDRTHEAIGAEYGIEIKITMRDFVLPVASLLIDGDAVEPRTGDRIQEGSEIFEIQPPNENTPSVELQTGGFEYIVHTKKVE
jgi:hypothetical protein